MNKRLVLEIIHKSFSVKRPLARVNKLKPVIFRTRQKKTYVYFFILGPKI